MKWRSRHEVVVIAALLLVSWLGRHVSAAVTTISVADDTYSMASIATEQALSSAGLFLFEGSVLSQTIDIEKYISGTGLVRWQTVDLSAKFSLQESILTQWIMTPLMATANRAFYVSRNSKSLFFSVHSLRKNASGFFEDDPHTRFDTGSSYFSMSPVSDDVVVYSAFSTPNTSIVLAEWNSGTEQWDQTVLFQDKNLWSCVATEKFAAVQMVRGEKVLIFDITTRSLVQVISLPSPVESVALAGTGTTSSTYHMVIKLVYDAVNLRYHQYDAGASQFVLRSSTVTFGEPFGARFSLNSNLLAMALDSGSCALLSRQGTDLVHTHTYDEDRCKYARLSSSDDFVVFSADSPLLGSFVRLYEVA